MYKLSPADILHFKAYSPDGIKGVSVLRRARQTLEIASAAQRYEQALYENGGRPSGILKAATDLGGTTALPDGTEISMKDRGQVPQPPGPRLDDRLAGGRRQGDELHWLPVAAAPPRCRTARKSP